MAVSDEAVLREFIRRQAMAESAMAKVAAIRAELFDKQLAVADDTSRRVAACCTRRAGKTNIWSRLSHIKALQNPRSIVRIWAATRLRAKQLVWQELKDVALRHNLTPDTSPQYFNETELTCKLPNGSEIRLLGADKDRDVEKKRGDKTIAEIVLEAQLFSSILANLVENVAEPCLFDMQGTMYLEGTPGPVCVGYWYDVSGGEDHLHRWESKGNAKTGAGKGWQVHHWSLLSNPHLPHAAEEVERLKAQRGWTNDSPTYRREYLGRWVNDLGTLYYKYSAFRNGFSHSDIQPWGPGWEHTLGWDLGYRDAMALVVWGYHPARPGLYEAFSWNKPGATSSEVVEVIRALEQDGFTPEGASRPGFNFVKRVADTGGGGRMYVEDVMARTGMFFEAAKKTEKFNHSRLLNEDLQAGLVKIVTDGPLADEMSALPIDPDWPNPEKPETPPQEDSRFANHMCDAALYSYRAARHYLHEAAVAKPVRGSEAWVMQEADRMEQNALRSRASKLATWEIENETDATWDD